MSSVARPGVVVALREEAVALDPDEDFAKNALGRGYQRQGALRASLGDVPGAVDAQMRRADRLRREAAGSPGP